MSNNICNCKLKHYQPLIRLWSYLRIEEIKLSKCVAGSRDLQNQG